MTVKYRRLLLLIVATNLLLGFVYSIVTPVFEASDEVSHYPLVQRLATSGLRLPVQNPADPGLWRQEGSQPPLYYMVAALGTLHIDTSDLAAARQLNPHVDSGLVRSDGNINLVMHDAALESLPWTGTILAVHVARFLSVLMAAGTVLVTFLIGREVFPDWPEVALGAAALNAFLPMFLFIGGSVNNDNLSGLLAGLMIWQMARVLNRQNAPGYSVYVWLGLTVGAGLLSKVSIGFMVPLVALMLLIVSRRVRSWRPLVIGGAITGGLTVVIAGWWYLWNWQQYGDPTGISVMVEMVGGRAVPPGLAQLWNERESFLRSWWGIFGGVNAPLPEVLYALFNGLGGTALLGFGAFLLARVMKRVPAARQPRLGALLLVLIWPVIAFGALLRWTSLTPASQGRLMFVAIGPISLWLAVGLAWLWRERWSRLVLAGFAGFYLAVAALTPLVWIRPAYLPPPLDQTQEAVQGLYQDFYEPGADAPTLRLVDYEVQADAVQPGGQIEVTLDWQVLQQPTRRWSLFVHAVDSAGTIAAQRDRYPGHGLLATERLQPGDGWSERVVIDVPGGAYTPDELALNIGLYDFHSGERMLLTPDGTGLLSLAAALALRPLASDDDVPNARYDNFADLMALLGYEVSARHVLPGDPITITLYWQGLEPIARDYTVFVHVFDRETNAIYGASDAYPAGGSAPTSGWTPGQPVVDAHTFTISPETPPGAYLIEVGVYAMPEPGVFQRLPVLAPFGGQNTDVVYLSRVAVNALPGGDETP